MAVGKKPNEDRVDPEWPIGDDGGPPVKELNTDRQGSLSPFGEVIFPQERVPYEHPVTEINNVP